MSSISSECRTIWSTELASALRKIAPLPSASWAPLRPQSSSHLSTSTRVSLVIIQTLKHWLWLRRRIWTECRTMKRGISSDREALAFSRTSSSSFRMAVWTHPCKERFRMTKLRVSWLVMRQEGLKELCLGINRLYVLDQLDWAP